MIQAHTSLKAIDNSGAKDVQCIRILGGSRHHTGVVGDLIVVSVKKAQMIGLKTRKNVVKKKQVIHAIITGSRKSTQRKDGTRLLYKNNCVVLLNEQHIPICTRIFGPIPYEIKKKKFSKLYALSPFSI